MSPTDTSFEKSLLIWYIGQFFFSLWLFSFQMANISQLFWPTDTSVRLYSLLSTGVSDDDIFMYTNLQINASAAYCIQSWQNAICLLIRCVILWNTVGKEFRAKCSPSCSGNHCFHIKLLHWLVLLSCLGLSCKMGLLSFKSWLTDNFMNLTWIHLAKKV